MNTQVHETTGSSPYELVFGQKPRAILFPLQGKVSVVMEEDLESDGVKIDDNDQDENELGDDERKGIENDELEDETV